MFKSIFTNSIGTLFSRILGFIRDLLTASFLGANIYSDIFFIAFKLPNLFRRIFAEGAFAQSFIPSFTAAKHKSIFAVHIFVLFFFIIFLLTMLVQLFPYAAAKSIALGFDEQTLELAAPFVSLNFYYLLLIFGVSFLSALLQYKEHFATTAFSTGLLNISMIGALVLSQDKTSSQIVYYLSIGVLVGGFLQFTSHLAMAKKKGLFKLIIGGFKYFNDNKTEVSISRNRFKKSFIPAIWGNSTAQFAAFLDTWLATFLVTGSISYLYYANRIFQLPLALFAIATSVALFPRISKYIRHEKFEEADKAFFMAFWFLAGLLSLSMIGGFMLSDEIIWLLFERGAFSALDSDNTAKILQMYMLGLFPFGISKLLSLKLYAEHRQGEAAKIATYALFGNIVLSLSLISPLGALGLALASSLSGFILFIYTVKAYGTTRFFAIIRHKNALWLILACVVLILILILFKELTHDYI
ncbi:murein biosynthesis integral membrane protein MurJ [Sulfurimonas sp. MAG313]|nr:murein biosynthesis integral membrane protein MurJ [Sulfurimonas sp. MAG313]MDF1882289.1 murein biosynthesis integral membrane protein MurJ [Sulfurimonas sp. MAG313]